MARVWPGQGHGMGKVQGLGTVEIGRLSEFSKVMELYLTFLLFLYLPKEYLNIIVLFLPS